MKTIFPRRREELLMIQNIRRGTSFEVREEIFKKRNIQVSPSLQKQIDEIFQDKSPEYTQKTLVSSAK
jgi:hypothetical protein